MEDRQDTLFDMQEFDRALNEWKGMPEYSHINQEPYRQIIINFDSHESVALFAKAIGQRITANIRSVWFPEAEIGRYSDKRYAEKP